MNLNERIDNLTEAQAKAALAWTIRDAEKHCLSCFGSGECSELRKKVENKEDVCNYFFLYKVLKEARK